MNICTRAIQIEEVQLEVSVGGEVVDWGIHRSAFQVLSPVLPAIRVASVSSAVAMMFYVSGSTRAGRMTSFWPHSALRPRRLP